MKCKVTSQLEHLLKPIDSLKFDPKNVRTHDDRNLQSIEHSLNAFGQVKPIVFHPETGVVIAGNGTLAAATRMGWTHIAATPMVDHKWSKEYAIADNRTAELAEWNYDQLIANLSELDIELASKIGFTKEEIETLEGYLEKQGEEKEPKEKTKESVRVVNIKLQDVEILVKTLSESIKNAGLPYQPKSY